MSFLEKLMDLDKNERGYSGRRTVSAWSGKEDRVMIRKDRPLCFYLHQVLKEKVPQLTHRARRNRKSAEKFAKDLYRALQKPLNPFSKFLRRRLSKTDDLYRLDQVDPEVFQLRIYLQAFLFPDGFKVYSGVKEDVPVGQICYQVKPSMTKEEKMVIRDNWLPCLDQEGFLKSTLVASQLGAGVMTALRYGFPSMKKVTSCSQGPSGIIEVTLKNDPGPLKIEIVASILGIRVPVGVRLQHAMPQRLPHSLRGEEHLPKITADIADGRSLWFADAVRPMGYVSSRLVEMAGRSWRMNFSPLLGRLQQLASKDCVELPKVHTDYINLVQLLRERYERLSPLDLDWVRVILMWEAKRGLCTEHRSLEDGFLDLLEGLVSRLSEGSCPHIFLPCKNMFEGIPRRTLRRMSVLIERIANDARVDPIMFLKHTGCVEDIEETEKKVHAAPV